MYASTLPPDVSWPRGQAKSVTTSRVGSNLINKRVISLTIGIFFDGTGNNAINTQNSLKVYTAEQHDLNNPEAEKILAECIRAHFGFSGIGATSYTGYYTNVYWLSELYQQSLSPDTQACQFSVYIEGIGTESGQPDCGFGQALGITDTGVIAKTDKVVTGLASHIQLALDAIQQQQPESLLIIESLAFDLFGFSRGAAAARHFANRIQSEDPALINAIRQGMAGVIYHGSLSGRTRFIGLFDTVAAIGTPVNGLNPHSADTGNVKLTLRPGVAEKVFQITASNECRFNFALNSIKPAWPELALPGAHADIGGGYLPLLTENLFLTRPGTQTVPINHPDEQTEIYQQAMAQWNTLHTSRCLAPLLRTSVLVAETWSDDRLPLDRYGQMQKRSYAALAIRNRRVKNDWSRVALRVMLEAAQDAGVRFNAMKSLLSLTALPDELRPLCEKALVMGKAIRSGQSPLAFTEKELDVIAANYIHCSANWNKITVNTGGRIQGGVSASELIGFVNRPDAQWNRTVYSMDGIKI